MGRVTTEEAVKVDREFYNIKPSDSWLLYEPWLFQEQMMKAQATHIAQRARRGLWTSCAQIDYLWEHIRYNRSDKGAARYRRYNKSLKGRRRTQRYEAIESRRLKKTIAQRIRRGNRTRRRANELN